MQEAFYGRMEFGKCLQYAVGNHYQKYVGNSMSQ